MDTARDRWIPSRSTRSPNPRTPRKFPVTSAIPRRSPIDPSQHSPSSERRSQDVARGIGAIGTESALERDPDFLRRLCARDREALGRFYELFFDRIYGYVRRMLGEDHLAEDVTQEVFVHMQRSITTYDPSRELGPWVFTIATNKVRDHWRSRRHSASQRETSLDGGDDETANIDPVDRSRGPLPELENEELRAELDAAIDELPAGMRETLILRWYEELSFEEIGRMIARNEAAARKRYSRAFEELRNILEKRMSAREGGAA